jgi:hypothetical protein
LSFYVGSLARSIGADVAWLPGIVVPTILYCWIPDRQVAGLRAAD